MRWTPFENVPKFHIDLELFKKIYDTLFILI